MTSTGTRATLKEIVRDPDRSMVVIDPRRSEISPMMRPGHISLPNGLGLDVQPDGQITGVSTNELAASDHRDPFAGPPYHKHVPARLERTPTRPEGQPATGTKGTS